MNVSTQLVAISQITGSLCFSSWVKQAELVLSKPLFCFIKAAVCPGFGAAAESRPVFAAATAASTSSPAVPSFENEVGAAPGPHTRHACG